ncbi:MAG TPA: folylpolyglutamate synthase/dihydrofolate synthase family protein [Acidobacteriota bacterium]|nr:folylpolyglutamate synthase/dihydrofolate synthase family protein [Acidobacteriota bacterium]
MDHEETLEYLAGKGNEVQMMHLGLHRTRAMMAALGDPQGAYPSIHIAGTNGKGSVAAMSESMLRHAGLKTGLYTSPHLVRVEERIRVNGRQVAARGFSMLATRIRQTEEQLIVNGALDRPLTTFEFLTCCAFLHFAKQNIDVAVVEVGMGGRLDATNIIDPAVTVITGVSLDHQNYLGRTIRKIAGEKAGIIKNSVNGIPVISGCADPVARQVVRHHADEVKAPLIEIDRDAGMENRRDCRGYQLFDLHTPNRSYRNLRVSLAGDIQIRNAAMAVMAIEALPSFRVSPGDIRRGLADARWEGRIDEYASVRRTLLDGAHNPESARLLKKYLLGRKETEIHLVFGAVRDKNIREIGAALFPLAARIYLTPLRNSRTSDPNEVARMHPRHRSRIRIHAAMRDALNAAWKECPPSGLVVITGSLYLVGELLPLVKARTGRR